MRRSVAYSRAQLRLSNAIHREDNLAHQRALLRQQIHRAQLLHEDHTELSLQVRAIHAEWLAAVEDKLAAQQLLRELKGEPVRT
jgi:hypothetical protein